MDNDGDLSLAELYSVIRGQIDHEDDLVSQRVLWVLLTQALLLNAPKEARNSLFEAEQTLLLWLLPTAALLTGLLAYLGIALSLKSIAYLRHLYEDHVQAKALGDHSTKFYPDIQGPPYLRRLAFLTPAWMPMILIIAWLVFLVDF
jgi:hypothetical protein